MDIREEREEAVREAVTQALGEASVLFMAQDTPGTRIIMPAEELARIANQAAARIAGAI